VSLDVDIYMCRSPSPRPELGFTAPSADGPDRLAFLTAQKKGGEWGGAEGGDWGGHGGGGGGGGGRVGEYGGGEEDGVIKGWPRSGRLDLKEVVLRYPSQAPGSAPALRGLTISLASGDRLGVVGRTGAGKSTILAALLRLVVPESGSVVYDGVDTARLRSVSSSSYDMHVSSSSYDMHVSSSSLTGWILRGSV
jgi:ABC-type multidrug transport system fused ATPase/permease subunit